MATLWNDLHVRTLAGWHPVATLAEASRVICEERDATGTGASDWKKATGDVRRGGSTGPVVARISYNGRIWPKL
jgi:hypothetical protein